MLPVLLAAGVLGLTGCQPSDSDTPSDAGPAALRALLGVAVRVEADPASPRGWGVLLDAERGLVLTAGPAVGDRDEVMVAPADSAAGDGSAGRVVFRDPDRGLAVVRLDRVPAGLAPLPFGGDAFQAGQALYTLPGDGEPTARRGSVAQVIQVPHLCGNGPKVIPWVVALDPSGSFGPPGAPVVGADGRLVGMVAVPDTGDAGPAWLLDPPAMRGALAGRRGPPEPVCPTPPG